MQNPFLWNTRAEVLAQIHKAECGSLCALTSSCTHTWEQTVEQPHCGRCSQCVDRRLAALSAGLTDEEDPPSRYRSDVVTAPLDGADFILAERYVGHLLQADDLLHEAAFLVRYPEVARVLRHVDEPPARAAELALDLYRRHARAVRNGLGVALRPVADPVAWRRVPVNSLLGIAFGQPRHGVAASGTPPSDQVKRSVSASCRRLVLDTDTFEARWGKKSCFLGNTIEFQLLERLNRRPGLYLSLDALRASV